MQVKKQTSVKGVGPIVLPPPGFESVPIVMVTMVGVRSDPKIPEPIVIDGRAAIDRYVVDGLDRNDLVGVRFVVGKVRAGGDIAVDIAIIISIVIGTAHNYRGIDRNIICSIRSIIVAIIGIAIPIPIPEM